MYSENLEQDSVFMQEALKEAAISLQDKLLPVGAVLVIDGQIVARAHKDNAHSYHLDHAEIMVFRDYFKGKKFDRGDFMITLYTTLEPCIMCIGTLLHLPIQKIVYAASDPYGGGIEILKHSDILPLRHRDKIPQVVGGILEQDAKKQLRRFTEITEMPFYKDSENPLVRYILE